MKTESVEHYTYTPEKRRASTHSVRLGLKHLSLQLTLVRTKGPSASTFSLVALFNSQQRSVHWFSRVWVLPLSWG